MLWDNTASSTNWWSQYQSTMDIWLDNASYNVKKSYSINK
jgi:hypothetical protein